MTRKRIENKIESLETKQQDNCRDFIIAKETSDGTYLDRETGKAIDSMDTDNTIILTVSDKTYATWDC